MDKLIELSKQTPFSEDDIRNLCEHKVNVITYQEVARCTDLDQVLGPHGAAVILYMTKQDFGHWVALTRINETTVEFFDSYGIAPDHELFLLPNKDNWLQQSQQDFPYLYTLMVKSKYKNLLWNTVRLQRFVKDTNTCGRWCGLRIAMARNGIDLKMFQQLFSHQQYEPDWYCVALTMFVR